MPSHFLADRGDGPIKLPGNAAKCLTSGDPARDLLAFPKAQYPRRASALGWCNTARCFQSPVYVAAGALTERLGDAVDRLARLISAPELDWLASEIRDGRPMENTS